MFTRGRKYHPSHAERAKYVSDFTQFMNTFLEKHPEVVESQHNGWNIYWDHKVDFDELKRTEADSVPFEKTMPDAITRHERTH